MVDRRPVKLRKFKIATGIPLDMRISDRNLSTVNTFFDRSRRKWPDTIFYRDVARALSKKPHKNCKLDADTCVLCHVQSEMQQEEQYDCAINFFTKEDLEAQEAVNEKYASWKKPKKKTAKKKTPKKIVAKTTKKNSILEEISNPSYGDLVNKMMEKESK